MHFCPHFIYQRPRGEGWLDVAAARFEATSLGRMLNSVFCKPKSCTIHGKWALGKARGQVDMAQGSLPAQQFSACALVQQRLSARVRRALHLPSTPPTIGCLLLRW